jgi:hypothetical protein
VERLYATLLEESNAALAARSFGLAEILCEEAGKLRQNVETANLLNAINNARSGLIDNLKKQAWLALKVWNLEAAERFIGAIGEDAPKDGSLEKLNQRRDAILQKAKPVYEALKPAWNHLRAADYLAAREQFAAAANLAPEELNEIEVWLSYTGHIEDAKKSVKGDEFDGAIASLRSAQEGMRVDEGNLPSVFGGANYVKELRQSAITHAQRLLVIVNELSQADKAYLESKRKNNLDEAVNYLAKEDEIKESFWQSLKMPVGSETPSGNLPASVRPMPKPNADSSLATDKSAQSEHTENRESGQYSEPVTAKTHISVETFDSGAVKEGSNQDNTQKEQDGAGSLNFVESAQSDNVENCPPTSAASNSSAGTPDDEPRENTSFTWNAPPPVDYD